MNAIAISNLKAKHKLLALHARALRSAKLELKSRKGTRDLLRKLKGCYLSPYDIEMYEIGAVHETVRAEARAIHLARGYLKGTPYKAIERSSTGAFGGTDALYRKVAMRAGVKLEVIRSWVSQDTACLPDVSVKGAA